MGRLLSDIVTLTPSALETWNRCRRAYLIANLLGVPESDAGPTADRGLLVHAMLHKIHTAGSCHDPAHVEDVLVAHGADDDEMQAMVARHALRCPEQVDRAAHEVTRARFHHLPAPMFLATARLDAVFVHDGLLDVRDYKTGRRWHERVADDPRARMQAYVLGRDALRLGLRLVLRYEHLAVEVDDDPEPWEPEAEDLDAVGEELRLVVADMWGETDWTGVSDATCTTCRHRSVCRDSAAPGEPGWAALAASGAAEAG